MSKRVAPTATEAAASKAQTDELIRAIKYRTLQLCSLIGDGGPKGKRLESALAAIRTGAGLAIDAIRDDAERHAESKQ